MQSFWQKLPKPFTILAPMEGVTDIVFRQIICEIGKPDVFFTEFTNCDGLMSKGREKVARSLKFTKDQQPVVVQLWGFNPKAFTGASQLCEELGFSGIDVNMGCPVQTVVRKGAGGALINNPKLAKEIIQAIRKATKLPVSVKTRLGFDEVTLDWIEFLLKQDLSALTIHLRTVSDLSKVPARWEEMQKIIKLRDRLAPETLIIGNGDINSYGEVKEKHKEYACDGFMIGRGVFANPWVFNSNVDFAKITFQDKINLYLRHVALFEKTWGNLKNPEDLKQFAKTYLNNVNEVKKIRDELMKTKTTKQMTELLLKF